MTESTADPLESPEAKAAQAAAAALKARVPALEGDALELLFRQARSHNGWLEEAVSDDLLNELYELTRWGATASNSCPARFVFIRSAEAKKRLATALMPGNVNKVLSAPVTAIIAYDLEFYDHMPVLFPHMDVAPVFKGDPKLAQTTAFRNGSLQGAYLMLAARALGLDCGPMSGFDNELLDQEFFAGTSLKSNFLCSLGYGDTNKVFQRLPRLDFSSACELL